MSDVHADAARLLKQHGVPCTEVIRVYPDAILFRGDHGRPMTAWLKCNTKLSLVIPESGFLAHPSPWVVDKLSRLDDDKTKT